jgi:hypothetical protein
MDSTPKFKVGEEVIINGQFFTDFNGMEATVTAVSNSKRKIGDMNCFMYRTSLDAVVFKSWFETSLIKKESK